MSRLPLAAATAGFVLAALLHLSTFAAIPYELAEAMSLALVTGAVALLILVFRRLGRGGAPTRPWLGGRLTVYEWRPLAALVPDPIRWLVLATALYAMMNFALSVMAGGGVTASEEGGKLYLTSPGEERRLVSREEFAAHRRLSARLYSGHLLLFYLLPLVYFRFVDPRLPELAGAAR